MMKKIGLNLSQIFCVPQVDQISEQKSIQFYEKYRMKNELDHFPMHRHSSADIEKFFPLIATISNSTRTSHHNNKS